MPVWGKSKQDHVLLGLRLNGKGHWAHRVRKFSCLWLAHDLGQDTVPWVPVSPFTQFLSKRLATLECPGSLPLTTSSVFSPEFPSELVYSSDSLKIFAVLPNEPFHLSTPETKLPLSFHLPELFFQLKKWKFHQVHHSGQNLQCKP